MIEVLLAITFVFGPLKLLTHFLPTTKEDSKLGWFFDILIFLNTWDKSLVQTIFKLLNLWVFYFSLIYQAWYWLFKN